MNDPLAPRHALPTHLIRFPWVAVTAVLLAVLAWMLYTPSTSSSGGIIASIVDALLGWLPGSSSPTDPGFDKIAHATGFAAVTAAALLSGWSWPWVIGLSAAHAVISEVIQWQFIPGRTGDPLDAAVDIAGILVAWTIVALQVRNQDE
ncbi:MAG: VanZ family protein [Actinomycetaceae bacterium]|nr:VanZ family protein [Actinomycetaceae bacterium]